MEIFIATVSIFALTGLVLLSNKILPFTVCPICAGVSGTWFWILFGLYAGLLEAESWRMIALLAMGGSVAGIAYQLEKRLPQGSSLLLWKTLFIPIGFIAVYALILSWLFAFAVSIVFLLLLAVWFFKKPYWLAGSGKESGKAVGELEKKMEDCC
ncbi:MAG: hypothetical protein HYW90_01165 [Candidatus Sungbacteria bacterium]|nr:hypothetical protein [Candidatus Sungbacteria bacterium]